MNEIEQLENRIKSNIEKIRLFELNKTKNNKIVINHLNKEIEGFKAILNRLRNITKKNY